MRSIRAILAGTTGTRKGKVLNKIEAYLRDRWQEFGDTVMTSELQDEIRPTTPEYVTFLKKTSREDQRRDWREAWDRFLEKKQTPSPQYVFLALHLTNRCRERTFSLIDWNRLRDFKPDVLITLIEDIYDIWNRIKQGEERLPTPTYMRLNEVMEWRQDEMMIADLIAHSLGIKNYVVPVKHPSDMLMNLLFREKRKLRIYAAFPVTDTRFEEAARSEIDRYRETLQRNFIVFDPLTIDEMILQFLAKQARERDKDEVIIKKEGMRWPMPWQSLVETEKDEYPIQIPLSELLEVAVFQPPTEHTEGGRGIKPRDLRFIDQSEALTAYRPYYKGIRSGGVMTEIAYASDSRGEPAYVLWPYPEEDGQFSQALMEERGIPCWSMEELLARLSRQQEFKAEGMS